MMVIIKEMESATRVQITNKAVCISLYANTVLPSAMGK